MNVESKIAISNFFFGGGKKNKLNFLVSGTGTNTLILLQLWQKCSCLPRLISTPFMREAIMTDMGAKLSNKKK